MKYWTEGNQIILVTSDNLLFGNYTKQELNEFKRQLNEGTIPSELTGISLKYVKNIQVDERKKRIDIELGKGSTEHIRFESKQLRNTVFDYIKDNFKVFNLIRPSSVTIWKGYFITLLFIFLLIFLAISSRQFSGSSPGAKAIGVFIKSLSETFKETTIILYGLALVTWRTIVLFFDLKALEKTLRLSRQ